VVVNPETIQVHFASEPGTLTVTKKEVRIKLTKAQAISLARTIIAKYGPEFINA
jgi:hypothetical protein